MGKKDKEHRKKVLKRNIKKKHFENKLQKDFKNQMEKITENFRMSGDSMSGDSNFLDSMSDLIKLSSNIDKDQDQDFILNSNKKDDAKINQEFEPEFYGSGYTIEDREIDVDTDMAGEFIKYEEVKNTFPANVEGSEEFNLSNTEQ